MNTLHISAGHAVPRRTFLKALGTTVALPLLEAMTPGFARGAAARLPRRIVAMQTNQGILPQFFFPEQAGADYTPTPYLEKLGAFRRQITVFSGVSHPGMSGGHQAEKCFLTGTPHPDRGGFRSGVSLDQHAAEHIGSETRFPSIALMNANQSLSFTRSGAQIPAEKSPRQLFEKLFVQGKASEVEARVESLRRGQSMLDFVGDQAKQLQATLSPGDRQRVDQYFTSVRELEQRLHRSEAWEYRPKPKVAAQPPTDITDSKLFVEQSRLMFDMIRLALETDSSRLITLFIDSTAIHPITHHGNRPEVIAELRSKEEAQFDALAAFLAGLAGATEEGDTLLDRTMVLYGTNMGSANSHSNVNLPVLLAGGGFKHGRHLAFDKENNTPLANLYVSMLQRLGIEADKFSTSTGTMRGLEMA
jgi:hypothetical protein